MSGSSEPGFETAAPQAVLPPIEDVMHDVTSPITVASLITNEYDFTQSAAHAATHTRFLGMPWYLFWFTIVSAIIIVGWLSGVWKSIQKRVKLAWTPDYGNVEQSALDRIPTEVSSARLLSAVKSEVDMAEIAEYETHRERFSQGVNGTDPAFQSYHVHSSSSASRFHPVDLENP